MRAALPKVHQRGCRDAAEACSCLPESPRSETVYSPLTVDVPPGEHRVLLRWGDTPLRLTGKVLTVAYLTVCLALVVSWRRLGERLKR